MSNNTVNTQALHDVIVATSDIRLWSGQVTIKREELASVEGLPPSNLVSDGSKRIINPKALSPLESQRRHVNRELARTGLASPMGYLIAPQDEQKIHDLMGERRQKFGELRDDLLSNFDKLCLEWEAANPQHVEMLRFNRPDASTVAAACSFSYCVYQMAPVKGALGASTFSQMASATAGTLADDVASNARAILRDSLSDQRNTAITQKAVNVVRDLVKKLRSFAMFDTRITATANALDSTLQLIRKVGPLDTSEVIILKAMLREMTDASTLFNYGSGQTANIPDDDAIHVGATQLVLPASVSEPKVVVEQQTLLATQTAMPVDNSHPQGALAPVFL